MTDQSSLNHANNGDDIPHVVGDTTPAPERYIRVHIEKGAKEYRFNTTVSIRWTGDTIDPIAEIRQMNKTAHVLVREEMRERELADNTNPQERA